jgi:hypothetical protein
LGKAGERTSLASLRHFRVKRGKKGQKMAEISRKQLQEVIAKKYIGTGKTVEEANERASADIAIMLGDCPTNGDGITVSEALVQVAKETEIGLMN